MIIICLLFYVLMMFISIYNLVNMSEKNDSVPEKVEERTPLQIQALNELDALDGFNCNSTQEIYDRIRKTMK